MLIIPKIIHYCWFGGKPLGESELACIDSWRNYFPNYQIIRWDETNFDVKCCDYVKEAYNAKKWAFVSDYARFAILYEYGGLYFDTDVEVIQSFDDVLAHGPFMGMERDFTPNQLGRVNPGLGIAASPGLNLYSQILGSYKEDHFANPDGTLNLRTVVERVTDLLLSRGLECVQGIQEVDGVYIYPSSWFNPTNLETGEVHIEDVTHSIHHYDASWQPKSMREVGMIKQLLGRHIPWIPGKVRSGLAWIAYLVRTGDFKAFEERY